MLLEAIKMSLTKQFNTTFYYIGFTSLYSPLLLQWACQWIFTSTFAYQKDQMFNKSLSFYVIPLSILRKKEAVCGRLRVQSAQMPLLWKLCSKMYHRRREPCSLNWIHILNYTTLEFWWSPQPSSSCLVHELFLASEMQVAASGMWCLKRAHQSVLGTVV